jgi:hypothetical protein
MKGDHMRYLVTFAPVRGRRALGLAAVCGLASIGCRTTEQGEDMTERSAAPAAVINLGKTLRVGWMGMDGHVGEGPGGNTADPIYKVVQWNPFAEGLANVPAVITLANQKDILLLAVTAGGPNNYGQGTAFSLVDYEKQLDKLAALPAFNSAVAAGRIHCYIADEPNLPSWNNTFTPTLVNRAAQENKQRWPGCLTYVRARPELLASGWGGKAPPAGGYTHVDYGWFQWNADARKTYSTISAGINDQKTIADSLNIGLALSMNMVNGGLRTDLDNVTACWDYDRSSTTPNGVVIGNPAGSGYSEGQGVPCSSLPPVNQNLMVNPNLIRRISTVAKNDADVPFLLYWTYPSDGNGSGLLQDYVFRSDFVSAFDFAIQQGASRTDFNGYRTPKP